jgi:integrase
VEKYELDIRARIKPHIGTVRMDRLKPIQIEGTYRALRDAGLAANTVHHVHAVLHAACREACRLEVLPVNVMDRVQAPRQLAHEISPPTLDQAKSILEAARQSGSRDYARWMLALRWGPRQGEALGLRWQDVDLDSGEIRIRQAIQRIKSKGLVIGPTKSRAGRRRGVMQEPVTVSV